MPLRFSANLGMLWTELSLPDAIRAAASAGFEAVEFHWPYETDAAKVKAALTQTELSIVSLNTERGATFGLSAVPDQIPAARFAIDQAVEYAVAVGAQNIHILAGVTSNKAAHQTFVSNLRYALTKVANHGLSLLIEPLNSGDVPGYFLQSADQAMAIIKQIDDPKLRLLFDCYHMQILHGDTSNLLTKMLPVIGHIQIASVPDRHEPDEGDLDYKHILKHIEDIGYTGYIGAEYRPHGATDGGLGWMKALAG